MESEASDGRLNHLAQACPESGLGWVVFVMFNVSFVKRMGNEMLARESHHRSAEPAAAFIILQAPTPKLPIVCDSLLDKCYNNL
jgi:hypothetical protein